MKNKKKRVYWSKVKTNNIIKDIKSLKIQGARNVALAGLKVLHNEYLKDKSAANINDVLNRLHKTRPTEPMLRNSLKYYLYLIKKQNKTPDESYKTIKNYFEYSKNKIALFGSHLIKNGKTYFTHCHSSDVVALFKKAKEEKLFRIHNTETRPLFQGRITATELSKAGIHVIHFVDSAIRLALKEVSIVFIGADAITNKGEVYNKIGSEMIAEIAKSRKIKVYVCASSFKLDPQTFFGFDEKIEQRHEKEVWKAPPRGVIISNYAFEKVAPKNIDGIISELGVLTPKQFVKKAKSKNKWMFYS